MPLAGGGRSKEEPLTGGTLAGGGRSNEGPLAGEGRGLGEWWRMWGMAPEDVDMNIILLYYLLERA
jgi:hypothetical protein